MTTISTGSETRRKKIHTRPKTRRRALYVQHHHPAYTAAIKVSR